MTRIYTQTLIIIICIFFSSNFLFGQVQGSLSFDGSNQYAEISNSPLDSIGTDDFTFEAWVKGLESNQAQNPMVFSNRGTNQLAGGTVMFFHFATGASSVKMLAVQIAGANYTLTNNGNFNGSILDNTCHHVAITRVGTLISFYIDGVLAGTRTASSVVSVSFTESLLIGSDKAIDNTFNGNISQIRIWKTARTEAELFQNKDVSLSGSETNLLAYWELNETSGQVVNDKTSNFPGVLGNTSSNESTDPSWSTDGCIAIVNSSIKNLNDFDFKVSPNPFSDYINLALPSNTSNQIEVYNLSGEIVYFSKQIKDNFLMDFRNFAKGTYFVKIVNQNGFSVKKIIKK